MFKPELLRGLLERGFNAALVVFLGVLGGDLASLFTLDWKQTGMAVAGAFVLEIARGLVAATGVVGEKGDPASIKPRPAE